MDSLSQIVLGAATGEVVLGKKLGNRALLWGAVAGTIPDLDVFGKFFLSNIDNVTFHRGFSHSITFCVIGALFFGYLIHFWYDKQPLSSSKDIETPSLRDWQYFFFWSLFTHPILDCFTMYGTELLAPFSDMRIAWATISVADPLYTLPFLFCVIATSRQHRKSSKRRRWNYWGIGLSSAYLAFTAVNKQHVNKQFSLALEKANIPAQRFVTNTAILNNILWSCTAETKDHFYIGQYSLFDSSPIEFTQIEKNHHLLKNSNSDPAIKALRWFTKDYYTVSQIDDKNYQLNDLRFGTFYGKGDESTDFVFRFLLKDLGTYYSLESTKGGPHKGEEQKVMTYMWERLKGK